jgi:hypothetical protein
MLRETQLLTSASLLVYRLELLGSWWLQLKGEGSDSGLYSGRALREQQNPSRRCRITKFGSIVPSYLSKSLSIGETRP